MPDATPDREAAIRSLFPLVRTIARRVARLVPGADPDDLVGDGCVGLIRAVDAFDSARGIPIERYAARVIAGAMLNGIRRLDPVSERSRRVVRIAERERFAMAAATGAFPAERELERRVPGLAAARAVVKTATPVSLDAPLPPGERVPLGFDGDPAHIAERRAERLRVHAAVRALPARQRRIVVECYWRDRSLRQLAPHMTISPQRASQLHVIALDRLRQSLMVSA